MAGNVAAARINPESSVHDIIFTAFDFETTGTNPSRDQIIEVGAVCFTTSEVQQEYTTLIKPTMSISEEAARVHGICDKDVIAAPSITDVVQNLLEMFEGTVLVAHNIRFDFQFLNNALMCIGKPALQGEALVDTLQVAKKAVKSSSGYGLQNIAKHFDIEVTIAHRALEDAHTCRKILLRCIENLAVLGGLALKEILL